MAHPQIHHLPAMLSHFGYALPFLSMAVKNSDYWADLTKHSPAWDRRTILMCDYISQGIKTLLEFGAGRCIAKRYMPKDCKYIPSDLVYRGKGTLVCDLNNRPLINFPQVDLMMFSGVLEYIVDVRGLISELAPKTQGFLVSYCCTDYYDEETRNRCGWHLVSNREFVQIFYKEGFEIVKLDKWENQRIYLFLRKNY